MQLTFSSDDAAKTLHMQLPVRMPVECGCLMSAADTPSRTEQWIAISTRLLHPTSECGTATNECAASELHSAASEWQSSIHSLCAAGLLARSAS